MILCHKCAGVLANEPDENTKGLNGCGCISGWVRGFEKNRTRAEAIQAQIQQQTERIELYTRQGREPGWVTTCNMRIETLKSLE